VFIYFRELIINPGFKLSSLNFIPVSNIRQTYRKPG
jgi:hypothetical protein